MDHSSYPRPIDISTDDPFGILASKQLTQLTTPISYCSGTVFRDPFGPLKALNVDAITATRQSASEDTDDLPIPQIVNPDQSLFYYHYDYFGDLINNPRIKTEAAAIISIGPDQYDSFAVYYPFPCEFPDIAVSLGYTYAVDTVYDATNGTVSAGDIARYCGALYVSQP
jgi:hypothetical protein